MRRTFKLAVMVLLSLFLLAIFLLLDLSPRVAKNAYKQVENAENVTTLISQLRKSFRNRYQSQQIDISYSQAESLLGFTQRALPNMSSDLVLVEKNAEIIISYQLPSYLLSSYINFSIKVKEASQLELENVSVGMITVPGNWALSWAESLANSYTKSKVASKAIALVAKTEISPDQVIVSLNPLDPFLKELKNINTSGEDDESQLLKIKTAHYLTLLASLASPNEQDNQNKDTPFSVNKDTSLSYYLHKVMIEARARTAQGNQGNSSSAALENEAAIMALAIYAGHRRFSTLFGDLSIALDPVPTAQTKPLLANRQDLSLHFIFSAAIKLLSEQGISIAVGEFKELMDRGKGGSGYSFVDLAADMAGANFAALAVDPNSAEKLQNIMSLEPNELLFFPSIEDLEEGMSKSQFKQRYTDIESDKYIGVVKNIQSRIERLPIGKSTN